MKLTRRNFLRGTTALGVTAVIAPMLPAAANTPTISKVTRITYEYFANFDIYAGEGIDKLWADGILIYEKGKKLTSGIKLGRDIVSFEDFAISPYGNRIPNISFEPDTHRLIKSGYIIWADDLVEKRKCETTRK